MALDSKAKRQAVFSVARPYMRNTFPVATPTEQWRSDVIGAYGGNALSVGVGRIMGPLAGEGGLTGKGGLAGPHGGMVG